MIPDEIQRAASAMLTAGKYHAEPENREVQLSAGAIVRVRSFPDDEGKRISRLALVVAVNRNDESARILLTTAATESATDLDLILTTHDSGLPYELLVEGELYGWVFEEQVKAVIAKVDPALAAAAAAALASDGESLEGMKTGWPIGPFQDARRDFKELELDQLQTLVREFRRVVDGTAAQGDLLDVGLLVPPPHGSDPELAGQLFIELLDVVDQLGSGCIELPEEWLDDESGFLLEELYRWQSDFGLPVTRILDRISITASAGEQRTDLEEAHPEATGAVNQADLVIRAALRNRGAKGPAVVGIYTSENAWRKRHSSEFILERIGSDNTVRGFARTLQEVAA
jgi:hypothetical protein